MQTKNALKIISLYDLIANNNVLIISTLHHIIILMFNHSAIIFFENLIITVPECHSQFQIIQYNLNLCQTITLFTTIIIYIVTHNKDKNNENIRRMSVMCLSCVIKMGCAFIQFDILGESNVLIYINNYDNYNELTKLGFYKIIEFSYILRFIIVSTAIIFPLAFYIFSLLNMCRKSLQEWSKTYKIKYIEQQLVSEDEEV